MIQLSPLDRWGALYARIALGAAFLSAVAGRFGLWQHTPGMKHFADFIQYTAEVNSFLPAAVIPPLAWTATVAETTLGILLMVGLWPRWVSLASAVLLAMFGTAMAVSFWSQVALGLFGFLCVRCSRIAGAPSITAGPRRSNTNVR
jgi:uncharacterized membrane protein YphA (DoxX/SURF4 family)